MTPWILLAELVRSHARLSSVGAATLYYVPAPAHVSQRLLWDSMAGSSLYNQWRVPLSER